MVRDIFDAIVDGIDIRQNLSKLRQEIKEDSNEKINDSRSNVCTRTRVLQTQRP